MQAPGPVSLPWRNYIAILAVSKYRCDYLLRLQEEEFLLNQGDIQWIENPSIMPEKLKKLDTINSILAYKPWILNNEHVSSLTSGKDAWSIGELVQVMIIFASFRMLAGLVYGLGVTPEIDLDSSGKKYEYSPEEDNHNSPTESLLAKLKHDDFDEENVAVLKEFEESENINILLKSKGDLKDSNKHGENYFLKYYLDHIISYEDFNVKKDPIFNIHDFSWKDQGYSFVRRYYSEEAAYLLDQEFNHIQELSYGTFNNHQSIKTEPFRKSIWLYIHRVQGVLHDDYNYSHINELLNPKLKKLS